MPQRPATGSGKERRFPSRFFPCEKAVTEDTRQRCKGAGHDYPDMRHAACCSGAQPVRMKARMGIGKPPVTPGTVPRTGQRQDEGKGGERKVLLEEKPVWTALPGEYPHFRGSLLEEGAELPPSQGKLDASTSSARQIALPPRIEPDGARKGVDGLPAEALDRPEDCRHGLASVHVHSSLT